jgi:branched-chain amino acid transport system ATP-binding protein
LLEIQRLSSYYGAVRALWDVSIDVQSGEAVAVLGPNGAGKSTLLRNISGLIRTKQGSIKYAGHELAHHAPHTIVRMGIIHVPEGRRIFTQQTVLDNLLLGAFVHDNNVSIKEQLDFVFELFPDLGEKRGQLGGQLSGGQQQMLAIGRALMGRPALLLLDEPSLGLSPIMVEAVGNTVAAIRKQLGTSILLVEQNAGLALEMTSRVYVMQTGRVVLSGTTQDLSAEQIRHAYLGSLTKDNPWDVATDERVEEMTNGTA